MPSAFSGEMQAQAATQAPAPQASITQRCPQKTIDLDAYLKGISQKPLSAMNSFELLYLKDHADALNKSLKENADINACGGPFNASLLSTAAALGLFDDVRTLLDSGANPDSPLSPLGESALIFAISNNQYDIVDVLLARGSNPRVVYGVEGSHYTPLSALARSLRDAKFNEQRELGIAKVLISAGNSPNEADGNSKTGTTPFIWAIIMNKPELVQLFLDQGADVKIKDSKGRDALDIARIMKRDEILNKLLKSK